MQGPLAINIVKNASALGNRWYVNELTGVTGASGTANNPFSTLDAALSAAVAANGDIVYVEGTTHRTTPLVWNKNQVSIVGTAAPSANCRARISVLPVSSGLTQAEFTALHELVQVTAQGCSFINIEAFFGGDGSLTPPTTPICWQELGGRNFYSNVQFEGGGDVLTAAIATMRSLQLGGSGENLFQNVIIGCDTIVRATNANASLELIGSTPRNVFRNPIFQADSSDASNVHILVGASGMDRYVIFDNAILHNFNATAMSVAVSMNGAAGGNILFTGKLASVGATAIATSGNVYVQSDVIGATTTGIMGLAT